MIQKTKLLKLVAAIALTAAMALGPAAFFAASAPDEDAGHLPEETTTAPSETPPSSPTPPMRPLPDWVAESGGLPSWMYTVDEFPAWFYELKEEPVWYRELDRVPAWFYSITEIPDWFYPSEETEPPENTEAPEPRPFPDWVAESGGLPMWMYTVSEFPDWFYELTEEPVWYRELESAPAWFYSITEIPDWFYPDETAENPEDAPEDTESPEETGNGDDIGTPGLEAENPSSPPEGIEIEADEYGYSYDLGNGMAILSSIPNGMVTNGEVYLMFPQDMLLLMRGDSLSIYEEGAPLTEHGIYTLVSIENPMDIVFSFRIISLPVNDMLVFSVPDGYRLLEAYYSGEKRNVSGNSFDLTEDGEYEFVISGAGQDDSFTVAVTLDTAAPALVFRKQAEGAETEEPLAISPEGNDEFLAPILYSAAGDEECTVVIMLNSTNIKPQNNTLTEAGLYRITVSDDAGNSATYTFRILYVMNVPTVWVIVIASLMLVTLAVYLIRNRIRVRVR